MSARDMAVDLVKKFPCLWKRYLQESSDHQVGSLAASPSLLLKCNMDGAARGSPGIAGYLSSKILDFQLSVPFQECQDKIQAWTL
ncbi:hypothetical protein JHK87_012386 [Glycine soja]|nr:hypothetical protein JHK87_012386 [Glycine soja]